MKHIKSNREFLLYIQCKGHHGIVPNGCHRKLVLANDLVISSLNLGSSCTRLQPHTHTHQKNKKSI